MVRAASRRRGLRIAEVEITYGTTKLRSQENPLDLILSNNADMNEMGLPSATRFALDRTIWLPWAAEFFAPLRGLKNIIIGRLNANSLAQLELIKTQRIANARARRGRQDRPGA